MKILITGAGGYIGKHVVDCLVKYNVDVIACSTRINNINNKAHIIHTDLFSIENPYEYFGKPDVCLHLAWKDGFIHNSDAHMKNLSQHYIFINKMISAGLKQIAIIGSMHEIGYYEGMITESTPCNPISLYGIAKDALRRSSSIIASNHNAIWQWIRAYYIYGDDLLGSSIFSKLMLASKEGKTTFPFTTGKNKYDFIHIKKLAEMISYTIMQSSITGIIECCSGKPISLSSMVEQFIIDNNLSISLQYGAFPERNYDSPEIFGDTTKIKLIYNNHNAIF